MSVHKNVRELDAKLLLALSLLSRDLNVVIGRTGLIRQYVERLPRGIYCDLRFLKTRKWIFEQFRASGHRVVTFDEEATSFPDKKFYQENLVCADTLSLCEAAFCWGPYHAAAVKEVLPDHLKHLVKVTGHPRFDILRSQLHAFYQKDVDNLHKRFGQFFLLNSSTGGWVMRGDIEKSWQSYVSRDVIPDTPEDKADFVGDFEFRLHKHRLMAALAETIAHAFPEHKLIIRPHYTESAKLWKKWLTSNPLNIAICNEASVVPWLLAAKAVIHNSCTTGTEAFLANRPVVSYRPTQNHKYEPYLPNALSVELDSADGVINFLKASDIPTANDSVAKNKLFDEYYSARTDDFASEQIADILSNISFNHPDNVGLSKKCIEGARDRTWLGGVKNSARFLLESFRQMNARDKVVDPYIEHSQVLEKLQRWKSVTGFNKNIDVHQIASELFMIISHE